MNWNRMETLRALKNLQKPSGKKEIVQEVQKNHPEKTDAAIEATLRRLKEASLISKAGHNMPYVLTKNGLEIITNFEAKTASFSLQ